VSRHVFPVPNVPTAHGPAGAWAGIPNTLPLPDWIEFGRVGVAVSGRLTAGENYLSVAPENVKHLFITRRENRGQTVEMAE
jgi:hypothetical protein